MTTLEQRIWDMVAGPVDGLGLRLVRVRISGTERMTLQLMVEPLAASPQNRVSVTMAECEKVSRMVSALMDVEDPIEAAYTLEVSSTGLERPLVLKDDFTAYAPHRATVELVQPLDGRRKFRGMMEGVEGDDILFRQEDQPQTLLRLPYPLVRQAKLAYNPDEMDAFFKDKP